MFRSHKLNSLALFVLDTLTVLIVFGTIGFLRGIYLSIYPSQALLIPVLLFVPCIYLIDGYRGRTDMMGMDYTGQHVISILTSTFLLLLFTYVVITDDFTLKASRGVIILSYLCLIPITLSYRRYFYRKSMSRFGTRPIVYVAEAKFHEEFQRECAASKTNNPLVFATISETGEPSPTKCEPLTVTLDRIERREIDPEVIVLRESRQEIADSISHRLVLLNAKNIPTCTLELFYQNYWRKIPLYRINPTWLFQEGFDIARSRAFDRLKRLSDIVLSLIGLLILSPLLLIGVIATFIGSGRPVFFQQTRIGKNREKFTLYKLRTMTANKETESLYATKGDARITRVGRFLRASRIDEIPQMWNVLKGDMSFIGPRAEWSLLVDNYEKSIPCYHFRHLVKPGITGWAQVNFPYGGSVDDTIKKLEYDLYYIRHFSFVLDAAIILKTIQIMFFARGR